MGKIKNKIEYVYLSGIAILSALLCCVNIGIEGTGNAYYAAAVKSMTLSWKNFFFVAMDPAGYVTVDKPPFGFWMQAISAKIFGFSGWSIMLPQMLAGIGSTILIYFIVKRSFGNIAGLISSLCLAITPVFVAASRNNTIDNQLVFFLLLACFALTMAAEKGRFKWLALAMIMVGIGFNIKQLQAYMIIPAVYGTFLLANGISWKRRLAYLFTSTFILLGVSFSWTLIVDSIPAQNRPYVGSSSNNTELELIIGHNGLERLSGETQSGGGGTGHMGSAPSGNMASGGAISGGAPSGNVPSGMPPGGRGNREKPAGNFGMKQGMSNGNESGQLSGSFGAQTTAGVQRLFSKNMLSDQIVWFIPLAFLGFIAAALNERLRFKLDSKKKQALAMWFLWLFPEFVYFSFSTGLFHPHYLTMMAPPAAALSGIGLVSMWHMYKKGGWKAWFLPVSILATAATQILMLTYFQNTSPMVSILIIFVVLLCIVPSLFMIINIFIKSKYVNSIKKCTLLCIIGLLITPLVGSGMTMFKGVNSTNPAAGLELLASSSEGGMGKGAGKMEGEAEDTTSLVNYLNQNKVNGKAQVTVATATLAESLTIHTDLYVGSLSGFMGNEIVMTLDQFKQRVKNGEVRYVLDSDSAMGRGSSNSEILSWVKSAGTVVKYSDAASSGKLYDLSKALSK